MALAVDTTTVADVKTLNNTVNTSGSFTAPANSRLLVLVTANAPSAIDAASASCSNTGTALTWTRRAVKSLSNGSGQGGTSAEIWEAWNASSQSITVSVTPNASASTSAWELRCKVVICTGDEGSSYSGATTTASNASGAPSASVTAAAGSILLTAIADWANLNAGTAGTNTTIFLDQHDTQYDSHMCVSTSPVSAGSASLSLTAPTTQNYNMALVEIKAPSAGGAPVLPPQGTGRHRILPPPRRRAPSAPLQVTVTLPPQPSARRRAWLPKRQTRGGQFIPAPVVVVTTQTLPPQPGRQARTWLPRRRPRAAQPIPAQVVVQTVQALPPQPGRRPPRLPIVGRHRTAQVVPPQVVVVTAQALPPQPGRRPPRLPVPSRHRTGQLAPAVVVVVTAQALPPQPTRRPVRSLLARRPRPTVPPLTVTVTLPPQTMRRRVWAPVRRPRPAQPVPAQVIIITAQALPPQPTRRLRWLPQRRRNQMGQPVPPQAVMIVVIPVTVTGTDRPTTTVTGSDRPSASVSGSDRPTVTITSN